MLGTETTVGTEMKCPCCPFAVDGVGYVSCTTDYISTLNCTCSGSENTLLCEIQANCRYQLIMFFGGFFFLHCVHFVLWTRLVILYFHSYEDHPINEHFVNNFYFPSALKVSDESTPCTLPVYFSPYCPFVFSATRQVPQMVDVSSDHHISGVPYSQTTFSW